MRKLYFVAALLMSFGTAYAQQQFGPMYYQSLGQPNGPAQLDGSAALSGNSVTATGGATARTLAARAADVINVKDFGVVCNGTTDDRTAINNALTAASTGNVKTVYFPASATACMMSSNVTVPAGVTVWAYPGTVTIKPTTGNVAAPVLLAMNNNTLIYGLTIDGGGQDFGTPNNVVQAFSISNAVLDHVTVQNTRGIGYLLSTAIVNSGVRDSTFTNIGNHWLTTALAADRTQAVALCCGTITNSTGNFVTGSTFTNIGLDAISVGANNDFLAANNTCNMAQGQLTFVWTNPQPTAYNACVFSTGGGSINVIGNRVTGTSGNGIDLINTNYAVVEGNFVTGSGQAGIGCFGVSSCVIVGNRVTNNAQWPSSTFKAGISLSGALATVVVTGNQATDDQVSKTQNYGIEGIATSSFGDLRIDPSNAFGGNLVGPFGGMVTGYSYANTKDNRIINPGFAIDSPNEGAAYAGGGGNKGIMEGWSSGQAFNAFTTARSAATAFPGAGLSSLLLTITTGSRAPAAGDNYSIFQNIEGTDLQDLGYGTAAARSMVLSFAAKNSVAGTYTVALHNVGASKTYLMPYTIAANTLTAYSFVVPGDTASVITPTSYGFALVFDMGSGSTAQNATTGAWIAGTTTTTPTATLFVGAASGTFNISDVRLYPGTAPLAWVQRTRAEELVLTQRRYRKTFPLGTAVAQSGGVAGALCTKNPIAAGDPSAFWSWGAPMRASPTIVTYNPSAANANWRDVTATADATVAVDPATALAASVGVLIATSGTVATLGDVLCIHATADAR